MLVLSNLGLIFGILEVPKPIIKGSRHQKIVVDTIVQLSLRRGAGMLSGVYWEFCGLHTGSELALHSQHTSGTEPLHRITKQV